jgi:Winged helix DNA-binding domain
MVMVSTIKVVARRAGGCSRCHERDRATFVERCRREPSLDVCFARYSLAQKTSKLIRENSVYTCGVVEWSFLTNHARVLVCIARDPGVRLRDIAATLDITERSAFGIVTDLTEASYVVKDKDGRRNRYRIQNHLPLPDAIGRERTIGEVLGLLIDTRATKSAQPPDRNASSNRPAPTRTRRSRGS